MAKRPFEDRGEHLAEKFVHETYGPGTFVVEKERVLSRTWQWPTRVKDKRHLLRTLERGGSSAARELVAFLPDEEVRHAILRALRTMRLGNHELSNLTQAIASAKLVEAIPFLLEVFHSFQARGVEAPEGVSGDSVALLMLAETLLLLDPNSELAARHLTSALDRAQGEGRRHVLGVIAAAFQPDLSTPVLRDLRATVRATLGGPERLHVPAMYDEAELREALEAGFASPEKSTRALALATALQVFEKGYLFAGDLVRDRYLATETDPREKLGVAAMIAERLDPKLARELVRTGLASESPWTRWSAVELLEKFPGPQAADLATAALEDEPDRYLATRLRRITEGNPGPPEA